VDEEELAAQAVNRLFVKTKTEALERFQKKGITLNEKEMLFLETGIYAGIAAGLGRKEDDVRE
jgi:hypothetical protein